MNRRRILIVPAVGSLLLLVGIGMLSRPAPALAQCGGPSEQRSSCITCHEIQEPVVNRGEWHSIHAGMDMCVNCHGGNASTMIEADAHLGVVADPLQDIYTDCHSCHPDYEVLASRFAQEAGVTPGSCSTPTPVAVEASRFEPPSGSLGSVPGPGPSVAPSQPFLLMATGISALVVLFFGMGWLVGHRA